MSGIKTIMPELPEVETIVRGLKKKIVGRKIISVWIGVPKLIKNKSAKGFEKEIKGLRIEGVERRAKNIIFTLSKNKALLAHQKMTGHFLYGKWEIKKGKIQPLINGDLKDKNNGYIRIIFYLDNGWQLALSDLRKFAKIILDDKLKIENLPELMNLGPEPLEKYFDFKKFKKVLVGRRAIKKILMDPKVIAGIGNIYADEILWKAKVNPLVAVNSINNKELKKIFLAIKDILSKAVRAGGSSVGDYRDSSGKIGNYQKAHKVYGREGLPCPRCKTKIDRQKIGGRSSHFCPKCQKSPL